MAGSSQWFSCPNCGQRFPWRPAYAGHKLSCKCGHSFVPERQEDPRAAQEEASEVYDVADEGGGAPAPPVTPVRAMPASTRPVPAAPVRAVPAQIPPASPVPVLSYRSAPPEALSEDGTAKVRRWFGKELILPVALLVVGAIFRGVLTVFEPIDRHIGALAIVLLGMLLFIEFLLSMILGVVISAKFMSIQFGRPVPTVLKLAGITLVASIAFPLVAMMDSKGDGTLGYYMAWCVVVVLYWLMFSGLFNLELQEVMMTVAIVCGLQTSISCILFRVQW